MRNTFGAACVGVGMIDFTLLVAGSAEELLSENAARLLLLLLLLLKLKLLFLKLMMVFGIFSRTSNDARNLKIGG